MRIEDDNNVACVVNAFTSKNKARKAYPNNNLDNFPANLKIEPEFDEDKFEIFEINLN